MTGLFSVLFLREYTISGRSGKHGYTVRRTLQNNHKLSSPWKRDSCRP